MTTSGTTLPQAGQHTGSPSRALLAALLGFFGVTLDAVVINIAQDVIISGGENIPASRWSRRSRSTRPWWRSR